MKFKLNILKVWYNELTTVMRDKGILIFILFVPLAYPLLYSYVYTNEVVRDVPAAVVDEANSSLSREFIRKMDASPDVNILARCSDMAEAQELMRRQKVYGIIRIPSSFERDIWQGEQTHIGLYCDMCSMLYYKALMLSATNVSLEMNKDIKVNRHLHGTTDRQEEIMRMPIEYDYIPLYNPQSGFAAFLIPPVLMLIIQQTLLLGIGMSAGDTRERCHGSFIPFNRAYKHPVVIVLGKTLFYFLLYFLLGIYMYTFVTRTFALPQLGVYTTFLAFLTPYLLACIFLAIVLSALVYRREDCIMIFVFLSVPMLFLSGISWPGAAMPEFWKYVSWLFPSTFGMNGYVRIQSMGASLQDVSFECYGLWIQASVYFLISCLLYRRQIQKLLRRFRHGSPSQAPVTFQKDGIKYHINNEYSHLTDCILKVPGHDYEAKRVFCNHRNTVELVNMGGRDYVVKRFKRPTWANCFIYTFFRKNKARRAYTHAIRLLDCGIDTPVPVAYMTRNRYGLFHTGWFISEYVPYPSLEATLKSPEFHGNRDAVLKEVVEFTCELHKKGIRHKDYNPGNILIHFSPTTGKAEFTLIDINQMSFGHRPGIRKSVISFMQNTMRLKEDIMPLVRYYSRLRRMPFVLCRHACYRYDFLRGIKRTLKKPVKSLVLAVTK